MKVLNILYSKFLLSTKSLLVLKKNELDKFFLMSSLMFLMLFNQNIVKQVSTSILVSKLGTESISFIKLWIQGPISLLFIIIYTTLCNRMTTEQIFRVVVLFFTMFFSLFVFILYPNSELIHPNSNLISKMANLYPHFKFFFFIWGKWSYVIFYVMSDFWPVVINFVLFWQFANKIHSVEEANRFYIPFGLLGQISSVVSGLVIFHVLNSNFGNVLFSNLKDPTEQVVKSIITLSILSSVIIIILHRKIEKRYIETLKNFNRDGERLDILKLSLLKSFKLIVSSKYLFLAFVITIAYSACVHLIEGLWFSRAKALYPEVAIFISYQSKVIFWTGISATIFALFGNIIMKNYGWFFTISITPVLFLTFGGIFFFFTIIGQYFDMSSEYFGGLFSFLDLTVFWGSLQNILGKGCKYSIYDTKKESIYIPLESEMKTKGKAAVAVLGVQIGKSLGTGIQFLSFTLFPDAIHEDIAILLMFCFVIVCIIWIYSLFLLKKEYYKKLKLYAQKVAYINS